MSGRPNYAALSYEWGTPEFQETILLNGISLNIRRNLHLALAALSHNVVFRNKLRGCVYLWIDALCIDQNNVAERGHQVGLMANISREAKHVMVWLGPNLDKALETVEKQWHPSIE